MKTLHLFFAFLFLTTAVMAQDFIYEGPARAEVRSFWSNAMGIQRSGKMDEGIAMMEAKLSATKQKDPSYKTADMEAELKKWKDKAGAKGANNSTTTLPDTRSQTQKDVDADKILRFLFEETAIKVNKNDVPVMEIRLKGYSDKVSELLAMNTKGTKNMLKSTKLKIGMTVYETNMAITRIEEATAKATDPDGIDQTFYLAKYYQAYWDAAQKIFTEEADYAAEYQKISALVTKNGTMEEMKTGRNKNNTEAVKNKKLPAASVKDVALERSFMDVFNARYKDEFKGTAIKAIITSGDWGIERNEVTGIVTGRVRKASIVYKGTDGKCYLVNDFYIHQEYVGGKFLASKPIYVVYKGNEMLCENVK